MSIITCVIDVYLLIRIPLYSMRRKNRYVEFNVKLTLNYFRFLVHAYTIEWEIYLAF